MLRRLLQLKHSFDLLSWIMRHALNARWTQFINHAKCKIIYSNVMDWTNVTKIHTSLSAKRFPGMHSRPPSTSGCVAIKSEIWIPLVTQGMCDLLAGGRRKNSQHKFTTMVNSHLWRHMMLECYSFQNICPIEYASLDSIAFFAIAKLNERRKGTKGMKRCRKLWLSQETLLKSVNKKQRI